MERKILPLTVAMALSLLLTGCFSGVEQELQYGNYEEALRSSLERMDRSPRKRDNYIDVALKAYNRAIREDKDDIARLKAVNTDNSKWGKIFAIYRNMDRRQSIIEPYLPLTYSSGREIDMDWMNLRPVIEEAREGAAQYHYMLGKDFLATNQRSGGRNAWYELRQIDRYYSQYLDTDDLLQEARTLGTNRVGITFRQSRDYLVPDQFLSELAYAEYERCLDEWSELYRDPSDSMELDFIVELDIESVWMSPQNIREVHYDEQQTVEDGVEALLDDEGNIVLDSSGNVVQVTKYATLYCHVTEWTQFRESSVASLFRIYDPKRNRVAYQQRLEDRAVFEHTYARANGHLHILPPAVKQKLNNRPLPFPADDEMIFLTANGLKDQITRALDRNSRLLADL